MKRKWQRLLIWSVLALTLFNILPTLFYYTKPLKSPLNEKAAMDVADEIVTRVDALEPDALAWLASYCDLVNVHPASTTQEGAAITLSFAKTEEAARLSQLLPRAGALIPFGPAQLVAMPSENPKTVVVTRLVDVRLRDSGELFRFVANDSPEGKALVESRAAAVRAALRAPSHVELVVQALPNSAAEVTASILEIQALHAKHPQLGKRLAGRIGAVVNPDALRMALASVRDKLEAGKEAESLELARAERFLKEHAGLFAPYTESPVFRSVEVEQNHLRLSLHPDLVGVQDVQPLVLDALASVTQRTGEELTQAESGYAIQLHRLNSSSGYLVWNLAPIAEKRAANLVHELRSAWHPQHPDLASLAIVTGAEYDALKPADQALSLVVFSAGRSDLGAVSPTSIGLAFKGVDRLLRAYEGVTDSPMATTLSNDLQMLSQWLRQKGFVSTRPQIFELPHFYAPLLGASREEFRVMSDGRSAILEFGNGEQRILTTNRIETQIHEELAQWEDDFRRAQVSPYPHVRWEVAPPTKSLFWENIKLSMRKLVRGDERKILRWGLDLSGGKTVQIELRDAQNRVVNDDDALKQGVNELFQRVNGMGVSDVSIRQTGHLITLDFPGTAGLSASELVKASSMYFHVVNEKFARSGVGQRFLQGVWNEAVVTRHTDPESLEQIAAKHLAQDNEIANALREQGLEFGPTGSKVVLMREGSQAQHPLLFVFREHALDGASLVNIQSNYEAQKGNYLSFEVSGPSKERLYKWTSQYCKSGVAGTARELERGQGWRMAALLNGTVITAPNLIEPIKDSASITGNFTQREVSKLVADLRAGSLTFTPHILSEKNVSPELGKSDRLKGVGATLVALALVIGAMILYYRFSGVVASVAVLFNLLVLWAVLQNIGASLSLAGLAGVILTVGMAVDANVLVFERMREEFAEGGGLASAIRVGYQKAFSAILDSNLTTIIAALILLNFDAGPIKAFAVSMIIGIASSMFTALFMTRFYFEGWVGRTKATALNMASWIRCTSVDFLKKAKLAFGVALIVIVAGGAALWMQRAQIFGMDFTGGYALSVELQRPGTEGVADGLRKAGLAETDFRVRAHDPATHVQIYLSHALEQAGKPFHGLAVSVEETNPRIEWVLSALERGGVELTSQSIANAETQWTAMSGQMSESMRNSALIGLAVAFLCIFAYIAIRFEYTYAMAAIGCLLHDVLITVALMSLLYLCGIPVQIDLNTIAALMTIIGYSLNDTIIIFDRVREDARAHPHQRLDVVVNRAVNTTLGRTTITSGTTLLVLLALLALGGSSVFSFALVMAIGVVVGTVSSWVIACPLMLWFERRGESRVEKVVS